MRRNDDWWPLDLEKKKEKNDGGLFIDAFAKEEAGEEREIIVEIFYKSLKLHVLSTLLTSVRKC